MSCNVQGAGFWFPQNTPVKRAKGSKLPQSPATPKGCTSGMGQGAHGMQPPSSECVLIVYTSFGPYKIDGTFFRFLINFAGKYSPGWNE